MFQIANAQQKNLAAMEGVPGNSASSAEEWWDARNATSQRCTFQQHLFHIGQTCDYPTETLASLLSIQACAGGNMTGTKHELSSPKIRLRLELRCRLHSLRLAIVRDLPEGRRHLLRKLV